MQQNDFQTGTFRFDVLLKNLVQVHFALRYENNFLSQTQIMIEISKILKALNYIYAGDFK